MTNTTQNQQMNFLDANQSNHEEHEKTFNEQTYDEMLERSLELFDFTEPLPEDYHGALWSFCSGWHDTRHE